ncbi:hypothetical protein BBK36DRAFT_1173342 [Trichoderma citrinoviride]|uniref:Circumsporozoite protein n=1 Tax=Trichoderma citrinoviride TaxID=58853 RepID=A0A2T4BLD5_9HYPO|nr:hypothetical protein BBK36DRAFT_1173342 [Trichoderma citrinoviride]PTB70117.1 hypothetical protein BBK36DRAFT_1173342 [Trichoderma citrinoviride]
MKGSLLFPLLAITAEARFGQEQGNGAIAAIGALTDLGQPGQAATLAGNSIQFLLAAANPCGKLTQADLILTQLGTSDAAVAAARGLVAAEQNFNPFVVSVPSICSDPTLPKSPELRGVVPLVDPAVGGSDVENKNAAASKTKPFAADGLSVAQVMINNGFSNFTSVAADGTVEQAAGGSGAGSSSSAPAASASAAASAATSAAPPVTVADGQACNTPVPSSDSNTAAQAGSCTGSGSTLACSAPQSGSGAVKNAVTGNFDGFVASTIEGLDFGLCVPTMKFEAGLNGRSDTEFTFQAVDPLVNKGQEEALNPNIITNRIHDQLTNVCGANAAAKAAAADAQTKIAALGTRNADTANTWNQLLGFAGANINPDNAPQAGLVGHT